MPGWWWAVVGCLHDWIERLDRLFPSYSDRGFGQDTSALADPHRIRIIQYSYKPHLDVALLPRVLPTRAALATADQRLHWCPQQQMPHLAKAIQCPFWVAFRFPLLHQKRFLHVLLQIP